MILFSRAITVSPAADRCRFRFLQAFVNKCQEILLVGASSGVVGGALFPTIFSFFVVFLLDFSDRETRGLTVKVITSCLDEKRLV